MPPHTLIRKAGVYFLICFLEFFMALRFECFRAGERICRDHAAHSNNAATSDTSVFCAYPSQLFHTTTPDTLLCVCVSLSRCEIQCWWNGAVARPRSNDRPPSRLPLSPAPASLCSTLTQKAAGCCACPGTCAARPPDTTCT
jgi:hypothetical protein